MERDNSFKEKLNCPEVAKAQQEIAMEAIQNRILRELNYDKIGSKLEELVKTIKEEYKLTDTDISRIVERMTELLNAEGYLYKVDEEGYLISNYTKHDILQKQFHDRKNKEANEKLQSYIEKAREIFDCLPEKTRFNEKSIEAAFGKYNWEKEHLWIELAVEKVWGCRLEICTKPKEEEEVTLR